VERVVLDKLVIVALLFWEFCIACDTPKSLASGNGHRLEDKPIHLDTIIAGWGLF
jgi:hypothetical protein